MSTQYPTQLMLSENDMINNIISFLNYKIMLKNKNKLIFDIYDKITDFSLGVNIFTCLHKSVYKTQFVFLLKKNFILLLTQNKTYILR